MDQQYHTSLIYFHLLHLQIETWNWKSMLQEKQQLRQVSHFKYFSIKGTLREKDYKNDSNQPKMPQETNTKQHLLLLLRGNVLQGIYSFSSILEAK